MRAGRRRPRRPWWRWARAGGAASALAFGAVQAYLAISFRRKAAAAFDLADPPAPGSPEFGRLVETMTGSPVRSGNRVEVLRNGCEFFPRMLEAIASAQRSVDFSSYIYWPGAITERFTEAFVERARAGVEVNVVLDGWGSSKVGPDLFRRLERGGVRVAFFRPPRWYTLGKLNNRMHRRLLVVDGTVGFAGGVGIADVWTGDAADPDHWRETQVRLEGPAVHELLGGFLENWTEAVGDVVGPAHYPALDAVAGGVDVQVTRSSPSAAGTAAAKLFYAAIVGARTRLWLTTAYFTAGRAFMEALGAAAGRGVDVRLLLNGTNIDKKPVRHTAHRSYRNLLEAGVRIFEYQPTMLHAKVLLVDEDWANVGTSNFDHRSFSLDPELNVSFQDATVVAELERQFLEDLEVSEEIDLGRWKARPLRKRVVELSGELVRHSL